MSPNIIEVSAGEARSKFAFLFGGIAELYRFYYGKKPSTKFEDIKVAVEKLKADENLSDYLSENLAEAFLLYPTLLPGVVAQNYRNDEAKEKERISKLGQLLDILIGDVCGEINDKAEEEAAYEKESLSNWLKNQ